ncbi:DUF5376 family protein [Psychrobacter phenylpyruvicus]|uniref:Uncharacterized protein n=1 Tax=Psychrobacter phenylpyruvicus TaxID=29432 RepID=A0A379LLG2_9GAMM|nr:DUF5376 family protein [Psychrobacter phenylpyruvicus]SUD90622.1 Uncharacterised protein [Psychrobacter phenylpyruvicus]
MHIIFYYRKNEDWNRLIPSAKAVDRSKTSELFSSYLIEIDYEFSCLILKQLNSKQLNSLNFSSESWGVNLKKNNLEIYSLFDEDNIEYKVNIKLSDFKKGVFEWNRFLLSTPDIDYSMNFKV